MKVGIRAPGLAGAVNLPAYSQLLSPQPDSCMARIPTVLKLAEYLERL